jgi:pimeloyl-ACP methyl ester carboxylesterase
MPEVSLDDVKLHVELDGAGEPVTVFAHGLTNTCRELAPFTPMVPGTAVRFCFRGHGHSSAPEKGYRFADFARDLDAVANEFGATRAVGTSLGAGAITHLLGEEPDRFERIVMLLPASLDSPLAEHDRFDRIADLFESLTKEEAIARIIKERAPVYEQSPWLRELDLALWEDMNPQGAARAIREVVGDVPIADRNLLRRVHAPVLLICRERDSLHPAELGRQLAELFPKADLVMFESEEQLFSAIPDLIDRVRTFLAKDS